MEKEPELDNIDLTMYSRKNTNKRRTTPMKGRRVNLGFLILRREPSLS